MSHPLGRFPKGQHGNLEPSDIEELRRFARYLDRRREYPDEPALVSYAEVYGEVVFEDPSEAGDR